MDYAKISLEKHAEWKGKIEVIPRAAVDNSESLSLAYTPGVAAPCLEIQQDPSKSYELTRRWNMVAVITDGTAVLGLGDIGPEAGMPVMEGKCVLFKAFGGVDAIPLCIDSKNVDDIVNTVYLISNPSAGSTWRISPHRAVLKLSGGSRNAAISLSSMTTSTAPPSLCLPALRTR